jgi:hypothetical protein
MDPMVMAMTKALLSRRAWKLRPASWAGNGKGQAAVLRPFGTGRTRTVRGLETDTVTVTPPPKSSVSQMRVMRAMACGRRYCAGRRLNGRRPLQAPRGVGLHVGRAVGLLTACISGSPPGRWCGPRCAVPAEGP